MRRWFFDPRIQGVSFVLWCLFWAGLLVFALKPGAPRFGLNDFQLHFGAYFTMTFTVVAFCVSRRQLLGWALATGSAGVLIECAQLFIPGRDFEFSDLAANAVGSIAGYALASAILVMLVGPLRRATA